MGPRGACRWRVAGRAAPVALLLIAFALTRPVLARDEPDEEPWRFKAKSTTVQTGQDGSRIFSLVDDVVILHGDLTATSDRARYLEDARRALFDGHVVMWQDSTTVRGPFAYYDRETGIARFPYGVVVERPTGTTIADAGVWWRNENRFELRGNAAAADTSGTIEANAMTYEIDEELFYAVGNARLVDDQTGVIVQGQDLRYDRREAVAVVTGEPSAILTDDDGVPIRVSAVRLTYDPVGNVAVAHEDARIVRQSMEATADVARFYRNESRTVLVGNPEIVDGSTVVSGERIEMLMPGSDRRTVRVRGAAKVSNRFLADRPRPEAPDDDFGPAAPDEGDMDSSDTEPDGAEPDRAVLPPSGELGAMTETVLEGARERFEQAVEGIRARELDEEISPSEAVEALPESSARDAVEAALGADLSQSAEAVEAKLEGAIAGGDGEGEETEEDLRPDWLKIPSENLPTANLLFGEEIFLVFTNDELKRVEVVGYGRSKFFPNEATGELTEWNDVVGDTLHVWFSDSSVDSVTVLGSGVGEYRLPAGEDTGHDAAELKQRGKLVHYKAPRIRYHAASETMHLDRGAEVQYKTMTLNSGEIDFEAAKEVMTAGGDPRPNLVDSETTIVGNRMNYHLPSQRGEVVEGRTEFENGYYGGDDVWLMGEDTIAVEDALYTTCDLEKPHYHFSCRNMKLYLDDKMVARPVVLRIRGIPVLALPYYMASLKKERHSGFLLPNLQLGVDQSRGRFIRNLGYYWAVNDYMDLTTTADFYPQQQRIVGYLTGRYNVRYRYDGRMAIKYQRDVPRDLKETAVELEHRQQFSDTARLTASGRFISSSSFYQDIDDAQRLDRELQSIATYTNRFQGNRSLRIEARRTENLDTGRVNEVLPTIALTQPSQPLTGRRSGDSDGQSVLDLVYYRVGASFTHQHDRAADPVVAPGDPDPPSAADERHVGSKADFELRTTVDLHKYLRINPSVNAEAVWQDEDRLGDPNAFRFTYNGALTARTELYGTNLRPMGPIRGFRHVIRPSASWRIAPDFPQYTYTDSTGVERDRFFSFGGIGATQRKSNNMNFGLNNLVQTKLKFGDSERRYDLFNLQNSISYDFLADQFDRKPWGNLGSSLTVLSSAAINQSWSVSHDPYTWDLLSSSVTTRARLSSGMLGRLQSEGRGETVVAEDEDDPAGDPLAGGRGGSRRYGMGGDWSIDVSHTATRSTSNLVLNTRWSPTRKWHLTFNSQYDLKTGKNTAQSWSIQRVIHCWDLSFDRRLLGGEWQYYFRLNVTDIPDLQAERGDKTAGSASSGLGGGLF